MSFGAISAREEWEAMQGVFPGPLGPTVVPSVEAVKLFTVEELAEIVALHERVDAMKDDACRQACLETLKLMTQPLVRYKENDTAVEERG